MRAASSPSGGPGLLLAGVSLASSHWKSQWSAQAPPWRDGAPSCPTPGSRRSHWPEDPALPQGGHMAQRTQQVLPQGSFQVVSKWRAVGMLTMTQPWRRQRFTVEKNGGDIQRKVERETGPSRHSSPPAQILHTLLLFLSFSCWWSGDPWKL